MDEDESRVVESLSAEDGNASAPRPPLGAEVPLVSLDEVGKEDSKDEDDLMDAPKAKGARKRQNFSWRQISVLEQVFETDPLPRPVRLQLRPSPPSPPPRPLTPRPALRTKVALPYSPRLCPALTGPS